MLIGELAQRTGVSKRALRYYEQKKFISSQRLENGYRAFTEDAAERVKAVRLYLDIGLRSDQIEVILNCDTRVAVKHLTSRDGMCEPLKRLYKVRLREVEAQIAALVDVKNHLEKRIDQFEHAK